MSWKIEEAQKMVEPTQHLEFIWNLGQPNSRYAVTAVFPSIVAINSKDRERGNVRNGGEYAATAIENTWYGISKEVNYTINELWTEANKGIEITNDSVNLKIKCAISTYQPEELWVKTTQNTLVVYGKHEEKDKDSTYHTVREFTRTFILPQEVDPNTVSARVKDSYLYIQAPKKAVAPRERMIAIEYK